MKLPKYMVIGEEEGVKDVVFFDREDLAKLSMYGYRHANMFLLSDDTNDYINVYRWR